MRAKREEARRGLGTFSATIIGALLLALIVPATSNRKGLGKAHRAENRGQHVAASLPPIVIISDRNHPPESEGRVRVGRTVGSEEAGQRGGPGAHNHGAREGTSSGNDAPPWGGRRQIAAGLGTGAIVGIVVGGFFGVIGGAAAVYVLWGWSSRERTNDRNSRQQGLGDSGATAGVSGAIMYVEGVDGQGNLVLTPAFGNDTVNMSTSSPQYNDKVQYNLQGGGLTTDEQNAALEQRMATRGLTPRKDPQPSRHDQHRNIEPVPLFSNASPLPSPRPSHFASPAPAADKSPRNSARQEPKPRKPTPPWRGPPQRQGWEIPSPSPQPQPHQQQQQQQQQLSPRQSSRPQTPRLMHAVSPRQKFAFLASPPTTPRSAHPPHPPQSPKSSTDPTAPPRQPPNRQQQPSSPRRERFKGRNAGDGSPRKSSVALPPVQMQRVVAATNDHVSMPHAAPLRQFEHVVTANEHVSMPHAAPLRQFEHVVTGERGNAVASSNRPSSKPLIAPLLPSKNKHERVGAPDAFVRTRSDLYRTLDDQDGMLVVGGGGERGVRVDAGQQSADAADQRYLQLDANDRKLRPLNSIAYNIQKRGGQKSVLMHLNDLQTDGIDNRGKVEDLESLEAGREKRQQVGEVQAPSTNSQVRPASSDTTANQLTGQPVVKLSASKSSQQSTAVPSAALEARDGSQEDEGHSIGGGGREDEEDRSLFVRRISLDDRIEETTASLDHSIGSLKDVGMETYRGRASPMGEVTGAVHDAMWRDGESAYGTPAFGSRGAHLRSVHSLARRGAGELVGGEEGARHRVYMGESSPPRQKLDDLQSRKQAEANYASAAAFISEKYSRDQRKSGKAKQARRFLGGEMSAAAGDAVGADASSASGPVSDPPLVRGRIDSPLSPRGTNNNDEKMDCASSSPRERRDQEGGESPSRGSSTKRRSTSRSSSIRKKNSLD